MPPEHVGSLMNGTAMASAIVVGVTSASYAATLKNVFVVWVFLVLALAIGGPPSAHLDFSTDVVVAISRGVALCLAAFLVHAVSRLFRHKPRQS